MISHSKISPVLREMNSEHLSILKDTYVFDFLNLPDTHSESDLKKGMIKQMKDFILEIGKDFLFV